jgi:hypothetical protein
MKRNMLASLVFATVLFAIPVLSTAQVTINLRTGAFSGSSPGVSVAGVYNQGSTFPTTTCATGNWWKAFVKVDLTPLPIDNLPRSAFFTVEYEGTPWGWTVDIGDSPTDDGYGGNDGTAEKAAEVQVVGQLLSVFDDNSGVYGQVDNLLNQSLSLTNSSLKFGVADQTLAVGQPRTILATPVTKHLFTLPDAADPGGPYSIYAGFNHVVKQTGDRSNRYGCGARFVTIWTGTNPPGV